MDVHVPGNPRLHYGHNGYHQAPHSKEDGLQFLSLEEKECILFFEETIDSLEDGLEEEGTGSSTQRSTTVENLRTAPRSAVSSAPTTAIAPSLIEHDIIDLVHSTPDFAMQDFQNLATTPQAHFEFKPKRNPTESVPATGTNASEESSHQPPPGSVPTPVIIASKIAEHQGTNGPTSSPSVLIQRRQSMESPNGPPSKSGPPTHAKPHRLPDNINMMLGSRDPSPQSIATAAVSMQERRSQMLANLPPSAHPLEGGEPACVRNPPSRSVSFRDPALDKSRMEALSMLGLTQARTMPANMVPVTGTKTQSSSANAANSKVGNSADIASSSAHTYSNLVNNVNISPNTTVSQKNSSPYKVSSSATASSTAHTYNNAVNNISPSTTISQRKNSSSTVTPTSPSSYEPKAKSEVSTSNFNSYGGKSAVITPTSPDTSDNLDKRSSTAPVSAEVTHSDFNSYGGKTITLNPTASFRAESGPSPSTPTARPEPAEIQNNSYGGRSRVINPAAQTDLPDVPACRPRSHSSSPSSTITASTHRSDPNSPTGGKSRIFPPAKADVQHAGLQYSSRARDEDQPDINGHEAKPKAVSPSHTDPVYQPVGRNRPATMPPAPAPRPQRPTGSLRPRPDPIPQDIRGKPPSQPSFRAQGVTVQFSGKGATDEARRDALRKLGLLKHTS